VEERRFGAAKQGLRLKRASDPAEEVNSRQTAKMKKLLQLALAVTLLPALLTSAAIATDSAVLRNGFSITHQRRQTLGTVTRLYLDGDQSFVDIPNSEIDHFESAPETPASTPSPPSPAPPSNLPPALAAATPAFDLNRAVADASNAYQLDPDLVTSVIRAESNFNVRARSPKGAQGLMQLMPQTASQLGVRNAFDPQANVEAGTRYLRQLLERYNFDLIKALAAYNAGPQRIDQYHGVPPYHETKAYVARIVRDFNKKKLAQSPAPAGSSNKVNKKPSAKPSGIHAATKSAGPPPPAKNPHPAE